MMRPERAVLLFQLVVRTSSKNYSHILDMQNRETYTPTSQLFCTFDLGLACALITLGYKLEGIGRENPSKAEFTFRTSGALENAVQKYWLKELELDTRSYYDNLKMLKNQLHSTHYGAER